MTTRFGAQDEEPLVQQLQEMEFGPMRPWPTPPIATVPRA